MIQVGTFPAHGDATNGRDRTNMTSFSGLIRALVDPYLQKAADEGVPAWLEATTKHSRDVYEHLGFREVDQIVIGEGKADVAGNITDGGKGITIFCMIIEPKA